MATFEIKMPKLGESITEGTIISWSVKVGDNIEEDDILFEVNTAKVSAEIPSPVEGKILKLLFNEGDTVAVGTVVAIVSLDGEGDVEESAPAAETKTETPAAAPAQEASNQPLSKSSGDRWYSPVVLQVAKIAKIGKEELDAIPGTGYEGRLSKKDIDLYIASKKSGIPAPAPAPKAQPAEAPQAPKSAPAPAQESAPKTVSAPVSAGENETVIAMDPIRRIIADRMVSSKKISPHVTNVIEVDVTKLVKWREQNKDAFKKREGISLTYMPAIVEASAKALKDFPRVNSSVDGYNIIEKKYINVGFAVSLPDGNLIVPVVKNADKLNISGLAANIASMADKARRNKLMPDEIQGGTFTITNFGSFKSLFGTPIINQPEVAILGVGIIEKKPSIVETPDGPVIAIRDKMYLSLSYDHRVIDGMLGGNFLHRIAEYLQNWED